MERPETVENTENNIKVNVDNAGQSVDSDVDSQQNSPNQSGNESSKSVNGFSASTLPTEDGGTKIRVVINDADQSTNNVSALPQLQTSPSKDAVLEKDRQRELQNRKRAYRKKRQAPSGLVNLGSPEQDSPANILPDDIDEEQQTKADQLMRRSRNRRNNNVGPARTGQLVPEFNGGDIQQKDLDVSSGQEDANADEDENREQPLNVDEADEGDIEQQLNEDKNESTDDGAENESGMDLITTERARVNSERKKVEDLRKDISAVRRNLILLFSVLAVAISKDLFDLIAEALSIGVWSWLDWLLDLPLLIAAFVLKIEKSDDGKAKVMGWAISSLEIIPYVDLLPAWTMRVVLAILNRNKEIGQLTVKKKEAEKRLNKSIKFLIALSNSSDAK
jgi:hypothetical protein